MSVVGADVRRIHLKVDVEHVRPAMGDRPEGEGKLLVLACLVDRRRLDCVDRQGVEPAAVEDELGLTEPLPRGDVKASLVQKPSPTREGAEIEKWAAATVPVEVSGRCPNTLSSASTGTTQTTAKRPRLIQTSLSRCFRSRSRRRTIESGIPDTLLLSTAATGAKRVLRGAASRRPAA